MSEYRTVYEYNHVGEREGITATEQFASNADAIRVSVLGVSDGEICLAVMQRDKNGCDSEIFSKSFGGGEFAIEYSFDPISLAVYAGAVSFSVVLESRGRYTVKKITAAEEIAEAACAELSEDSEVSVAPVAAEVPNHVLFAGNSLVFGMGKRYGMCASAPDKDYYHYVSEYIGKHNPVCKFDKLYISMFEHAESLEAFEKWYNTDCEIYADNPIPAKDAFTHDLDLIFLQLGDNVNTDEKVANFATTADMLVERIKATCPKARIIWIHGWYNKARTMPYIEELCRRWGIERIDISGIRSRETEAHSQKYYLDANDGTLKEVSERWITHPGDLGMKMIADLMIEKLRF